MRPQYQFLAVLHWITVLAIGSSYAQSSAANATPAMGQAVAHDTVLLEIVREVSGMVPYQGKWLYFRLHSSGRAEFETLRRSGENAEMKPVKHEMQLSLEDQAKIIELIEDRGFLSASGYYKRAWPSVDVLSKTIIITSRRKEKPITLENFYPDLKDSYPEAVVTLMRTIEALLKSAS